MNIQKMADDRGINLTEKNGVLTATFGTEHLLSTTMPQAMVRFFDECELVIKGRFECLRISGFIEHVKEAELTG